MYREIDEERQHMKEMAELDDAIRLRVARSMIRFGGGFVKALGEALLRADQQNTRKIKQAFPEYWERYSELADREQNEDENQE